MTFLLAITPKQKGIHKHTRYQNTYHQMCSFLYLELHSDNYNYVSFRLKYAAHSESLVSYSLLVLKELASFCLKGIPFHNFNVSKVMYVGIIIVRDRVQQATHLQKLLV